MQVIRDIYRPNTLMTALGTLAGLYLGSAYDKREERDVRKIANQMDADADARVYRRDYDEANNAYNNALTQYTKEYQKNATGYNNAKTDEERQGYANKLNKMAKEINPNFDESDANGWTTAQTMLKNGQADNFQTQLNNVNALKNKLVYSRNYKNAMHGKRVSDGTFKDYDQYMSEMGDNPIPEYVPSQGTSTQPDLYNFYRSRFNYGGLMPYYPYNGGQ